MLTFNGVIVILKLMNTYFLSFLVLTCNMVNLSFNPHKQKLFGVISNF